MLSTAAVAARLAALADRSTAGVRELRRAVSAQLSAAPPDEVLALAGELARSGDDVRRFVAYELVAEHPATMRALGVRAVEHLGRGMASWVAVDTFACYVSGPAWREGRIGDDAIARWARSPDRWWRRAALVSTVPLNVRARGGRGDAGRTLPVCAMLAHDRDPMVWKALSWALRSLAVRDPARVRAFIADHETEIARPVLREVRSKLETGRKN